MLRTFAAALVAAAAFALPASAALVVNPTTIGQKVIVASTDEVIARYEGSNALFISQLYLYSPRPGADPVFLFDNSGAFEVGAEVNLGSFIVGDELIFQLLVDDGNAYYSGDAERNPDGLPHAAANTDGGVTFVGFEDLFGVTDDFDDLIFSFTNTEATVGEAGVPEPGTWALMILGFGAAGALVRRRKAVAA